LLVISFFAERGHIRIWFSTAKTDDDQEKEWFKGVNRCDP